MQKKFGLYATPKDGALAGLIATLPMTVVMLAIHKMLPRSEQYPLPPEQITSKLVNRVGSRSLKRSPILEFLTGVNHFSFGAATGILFIPIAKFLRFPLLLSGLFYGILVWFISYQGWVPQARFLPPATRQPPRRNLMMILAHLVWGGVLAWLLNRWTTEH